MNTKGYSSATISKWFKVYMDILVNDFSFSQAKIGGENIIVECDESKFDKRMYHKGHRVEGIWVFGLVVKKVEKEMLQLYYLLYEALSWKVQLFCLIVGELTMEFKVSLDWLMKQSTTLKILLNESL